MSENLDEQLTESELDAVAKVLIPITDKTIQLAFAKIMRWYLLGLKEKGEF